MVAMGGRFLASTIYRELLADSPRQMEVLATAFVNDPDKVALIAVDANRVTGMILVLLHTHFLSGEQMAGEVAWWVEPDARGTGLRLLRAAERWAREHGAVKFQMIAPTPDVERIYQARHYAKVETTYQLTL